MRKSAHAIHKFPSPQAIFISIRYLENPTHIAPTFPEIPRHTIPTLLARRTLPHTSFEEDSVYAQ
jgi:hypothetical protein